MKFINKNAFTLTELLISITILSILATVAFQSYSWYLSSSRDSIRAVDIESISKSLRIYPLYNWYYPAPSNWESITYSNEEIWSQWTIWQSIVFLLEEIEDIPLDPLTLNEYTYSVLNTNKEFELASILENSNYSYNNIIEKTNAWTINALAHVNWNFNWVLSQVRIWTTDYLISTPSIITSSIDTMENIILNSSFVFDWLENLPSGYIWSDFNLEWSSHLTFLNSWLYDPVVYNGCVSELRQDEDYDTNRWIILKLQDLYSWTDIANKKSVKNLLDIDSSTWSTELITYMESLYSKLAVNPWCGEAIYYCTSTPGYNHTNYISWIATEIAQAWQDDDSWSPCYYICTDSYTWWDCSIEPYVEWVCWTDNGTNTETTPTFLCNAWDLDNLQDGWIDSTYTWDCLWTGWAPNANPSCSANHILNWVCWTDNTLTLTETPTNLCNAWTSSTVSDSWVPWTYTWICEWSTLWSDASCSADHVGSIDWLCWDDDGTQRTTTPTLLCDAWTDWTVTDNWEWNTYTWDCLWINGWNPVSCSADHLATPVDWFCWGEHTLDMTSEPTNLCYAWIASTVYDEWLNLNWTWTCAWTDLWADVSCYANHIPEIIGVQLTYNWLVNDDIIELPFNGTVNIHKIDWGDGWANWCPTTASLWISCTYADASLSNYTVKIYWTSSGFGSSATNGIEKLVSIDKWDELWLTSLAYIWANATILTTVPSYLPTWIIDLKHMFEKTDIFNQDISTFATGTTNVTDMEYMFSYALLFDQDISNWCVTNIPSLPLKFDFQANSSWSTKPVWWTCP